MNNKLITENDIIEKIRENTKDSIYLDKSVFSVKYIPKEIYYRVKEIKEISNKLSMIYQNSENINIWGMTSTGKTLSIKYIIKILEKVWTQIDKKIEIIYIPCEDYNTRSSVLGYIIKKLGDNKVPVKADKSVYLERMDTYLSHIDHLLLIFDDIDIFISKNNNEDVIWSLTDRPSISQVFISNVYEWYKNMDIRIIGRLQLNEIEFSAYTKEEIYGILKQRINLGLKKEIITDEFLDNIVKKLYYNTRDLRDMIRFLRILLDKIDYNIRNKIKVDLNEDLIEKSFKDLTDEKINKIIKKLDPKLQMILFLIARCNVKKMYPILTNKELFDEWNKTIKKSKYYSEVSYRTFLDYTKELKLYNFIYYNMKSLGRGKGIQYEIILKINPQIIYKYFNDTYDFY